MTETEVKQAQEQSQAVLESAVSAADSAAKADKAAAADLVHERERLAAAQAEVTKLESELAATDPDTQSWRKARAALSETGDRITSLQKRVEKAEAKSKVETVWRERAQQAVVEAKADVAFAKHEEVVVELRELLAKISEAAAAKLATLGAARDEFDAAAVLPNIAYVRTEQALAPHALEKSKPGLEIAGYLMAVAKQLITGLGDAEASIAWCEADQRRRLREQSPSAAVPYSELLHGDRRVDERDLAPTPVSKTPEEMAVHLARHVQRPV